MKEIVEKSEDGRDVSDFYEFEQIMDHDQRVKIINIILDEVFKRKVKLSRKDFDELAGQIVTIFPNESKVKVIRVDAITNYNDYTSCLKEQVL